MTAYAYNPAGRLTQITYPSGRIVSFALNGNGQVTGITTKKNATASVSTVGSNIAWQPMLELLASYDHGNGLRTVATYDLDYRLSGLKLYNPATGKIFAQLSYGYGDGINLTAINDLVTPGKNVTMSYNAANQLASAQRLWGLASYTYDFTGNRKTETIGSNARSFTYAITSNRIQTEALNSVTTRSFTNDGAGNIQQGPPVGVAYSLVYYKRNRPSALQQCCATAETSPSVTSKNYFLW